MDETSTESFKHIILCVDQTPSMGYTISHKTTIMDAVNKGVTAFTNVFKESTVKANVTSITFDTKCQIAHEVSIETFTPNYSVQKNGTVRIADVLNMAAEHFRTLSGDLYIIFISDGIVDPGEDEESLAEAIARTREFNSYAVGFSSSNGKKSLDCLLDCYTNKQIVSFDKQQSYIDELKAIANEIIQHVSPCGKRKGEGSEY